MQANQKEKMPANTKRDVENQFENEEFEEDFDLDFVDKMSN